jgi:allantoicase
LAILLPAAAMVAIILPTQLLHLKEFEAFASILTMLLAAAIIFNLTVVPQICAWTDGWRSSGPRLNEARVAPQPREDLGDDIF